ncbi:MAG: site-specific integrase [Nannocystaceae bacterium]
MITLRPWKGTKSQYEADITLRAPDGRKIRKRIKVPVTGKTNAERWARAREQELLAQLLVPSTEPEPEPEADEELRPPTPTLGEFAATFLQCCKADRLALNTLTNYDVHLRVHILPVLGERPLDRLCARDLMELKLRLVDKAQSTAAEILKTLKCLLGRAVGLGVLERVPFVVEVPRRTRKQPSAYTEAETEALLEAAENDPQARAMVLLGIDGGLRRGEILALRWDDVDLKRRLVTVRRTVVRGEVSETTKSRTESTVGLTRRLAAALRAIRHDRAPYVLVNRRGNHWREERIRKVLRRLVKRAGIRWLGTHVLRRTCATRIADNGGGVNAVAAQLRHSGLQMASRYVDRRSGAARRACEALER